MTEPKAGRPGRRCRVCATEESEPFFRLPGVPVQDGLLWPSEREALSAPTGDIELVFCPSCGYIGNRSFDPAKLRYDPTYDISLHHSPVYQQFIEELVDRLTRDHELSGKSVLEIGCGKGDFLRALCKRASSCGVGFDPTAAAEEPGASGGVRIITEFYSERFADEPVDLLCCRHVLNSIADLRGFLGSVRRTLGARSSCALYFEVPDGAVVFRRRVVWNVVYEHCSYFTDPSLGRLFTESGFEVRRIAPCFRDEYLGIEANPATDGAAAWTREAAVAQLASDVEAFGGRYREAAERWGAWLSELRRTGRRAVLWGAGARAVAFLSALRPGPEVAYLVDVNPQRQGLFLPRTGNAVAAPEMLLRDRPDAILITNPAFEGEIRKQASDLGVRGDILALD